MIPLVMDTEKQSIARLIANSHISRLLMVGISEWKFVCQIVCDTESARLVLAESWYVIRFRVLTLLYAEACPVSYGKSHVKSFVYFCS